MPTNLVLNKKVNLTKFLYCIFIIVPVKGIKNLLDFHNFIPYNG